MPRGDWIDDIVLPGWGSRRPMAQPVSAGARRARPATSDTRARSASNSAGSDSVSGILAARLGFAPRHAGAAFAGIEATPVHRLWAGLVLLSGQALTAVNDAVSIAIHHRTAATR